MSCAPYVSSSPEIVREMLEIAKVRPKDLVYDLGCGDGRILIAAVKDFKAIGAVGYEIREDVYEIALAEIVKQNLQDKIKLINGDFFKADISRATVITLYLTTRANEALRPKLEKEARLGARVVSHNYELPGWQPSYVKKSWVILFTSIKFLRHGATSTISLRPRQLQGFNLQKVGDSPSR